MRGKCISSSEKCHPSLHSTRVLIVILHVVWETGTECLNRSLVCRQLSHGLAVVLRGCDLVVSGTEEGG